MGINFLKYVLEPETPFFLQMNSCVYIQWTYAVSHRSRTGNMQNFFMVRVKEH